MLAGQDCTPDVSSSRSSWMAHLRMLRSFIEVRWVGTRADVACLPLSGLRQAAR